MNNINLDIKQLIKNKTDNEKAQILHQILQFTQHELNKITEKIQTKNIERIVASTK